MFPSGISIAVLPNTVSGHARNSFYADMPTRLQHMHHFLVFYNFPRSSLGKRTLKSASDEIFSLFFEDNRELPPHIGFDLPSSTSLPGIKVSHFSWTWGIEFFQDNLRERDFSIHTDIRRDLRERLHAVFFTAN